MVLEARAVSVLLTWRRRVSPPNARDDGLVTRYLIPLVSEFESVIKNYAIIKHIDNKSAAVI